MQISKITQRKNIFFLGPTRIDLGPMYFHKGKSGFT